MRKRVSGLFLVQLVCILIFSDVCAQKKFILDINAGAHQSFGNNITKTYSSNIRNLTVYYFSRDKFERTYFSLLPNLSYHLLRPNVLIGVQSGVYAHFNERFFGYRKPVFITVPLMITARGNIASIKSNSLGINLAGGKNFFSTETYPAELKNGILLNASVFYLIKQRHIFKVGIEKQVDNGFSYVQSTNPLMVDETFEYKLNKISAFVSYGITIKKF